MRLRDILEDDSKPVVPSLLFHGTTSAKAKAIVAGGFVPRGRNNTFGKSISFSDKPVGTRIYDKGAILAYRFLPSAKVLSLSQFQKMGRGDADGVIGGVEGYYQDREVAVFNPAAIEWVGYYNLQTKKVEQTPPVYSKGFYHSWADEPPSDPSNE